MFYCVFVQASQNDDQCPLHNVTYAPSYFEVATFKGFGEDAYTRKYVI